MVGLQDVTGENPGGSAGICFGPRKCQRGPTTLEPSKAPTSKKVVQAEQTGFGRCGVGQCWNNMRVPLRQPPGSSVCLFGGASARARAVDDSKTFFGPYLAWTQAGLVRSIAQMVSTDR
jgi:hypothetical protein